jgi:LDH2 family malate/lactate/ureidoglycolate dehydrogenase
MLEAFKVPSSDSVAVHHDALRVTVAAIFAAHGVPPEAAAEGAAVLVAADLRGVESHGVSNRLRSYVQAYRAGTLNPRAELRLVQGAPGMATLDGDGGLGIMQGSTAMRMAIDKARANGIGVVVVGNSGHLGAVGHFALQAVREEMVGFTSTAAGLRVVPTFGALPRLGTNPIAIAAPTRTQPPLLFDVATSAIANNKVELLARLGEPAQAGWVAAVDGTPIMDTRPAPVGSALLPIGSTRELGSHKGYGLGLMVEVLAGLLAGALPTMLGGRGFNHHFAAYNIAAFTELDWFKDTLDAMLRTLRETPPTPGHARVLYPGLPEYEEEQRRRADGIPLHREVVAWIDATTDELDLPRLER